MPRAFDTTAYRYPRERMILALTLLLVFLVIALTATATVCLSVIFVLVMLVLSYTLTRAHHQSLLEEAEQVTPQDPSWTGLAALASECVHRLQVKSVQVFVAPRKGLNAYTFGLSSPKVVVLHASLLGVMDEDEMRFILGHELGHVRLGHTWLNSLVGGMAGIPSPFVASAILTIAFLWWNRACEYSADRAGLLACGKPHKAVSALVKLAAGEQARTRADLERALEHIQAEDDHALSNVGEMLGTHPMMVRRIEELQRYAVSSEYHRLQQRMDGNVPKGPERG